MFHDYLISVPQNIQLSVRFLRQGSSDKVPQTSSEFQTQIQPQRPIMFSKDIESPFGHGEVINYTGVSIHPVTTKIQTSFLTQLPERKETAQRFHHETNGDCKTVKSLMAVIGGN